MTLDRSGFDTPGALRASSYSTNNESGALRASSYSTNNESGAVTIALRRDNWDAPPMPALLSSRVFLYPKTGKFPTEAALLELSSDNTVRLTKVDPQSGSRRDIVFDDSLADIQVGGSGTVLSFTTNGSRWRVDFSPYNAGQRIITAEQANTVMFSPADAGTWAAKITELGYPTRYRGSRALRMVVLLVLGVVLLTAVIVLLSSLRNPIFS